MAKASKKSYRWAVGLESMALLQQELVDKFTLGNAN